MKALKIFAQVTLAAFVLLAGASLTPSSSQAGQVVLKSATNDIVQKHGADDPDECIVDNRC